MRHSRAVAVELEHAAPPAEGVLRRRRPAYRAAVLVATAAVGTAVVLVPLAASSLVAILRRPVAGRVYQLASPAKLGGEWTRLNVAAVKLDESAGTVTLRVSGFHNCPAGACAAERVQLFSVHADPTGALGSPPSATVDLPKDSSEIEQQVTLPIEGNLVDYPFDHYRLLLGVAFARVSAAGAATPFGPRVAGHGLAYSVGDEIPRVSMAAPRLSPPGRYDAPGVVYDSVAALGFSRPTYLRVITVDLILLTVISAIYGVVFRPFTQIVPTVGGVVLGVWGVRSLLVGSYPADSTGVDLVLESAILLVLLLVGVRSVRFLWRGGHEHEAAR